MTRHFPEMTAARLRRMGRVALALLALGSIGAAETGAFAQGVDCNRLQQQIIGLGPTGSADPARAQQFRDAVQRQATELERTVAYSHSIGC